MASPRQDTTFGFMRLAWRALASTRLALWVMAGLGLLQIAGMLIPQLPTTADDATQEMWYRLALDRYGSLYAPLRFLGLFQVHRSPLFLALGTALLGSTMLCTINRLPGLIRSIRRRRVGAVGSLISHIAVIGLLLSLSASEGWSWQAEVSLAEGETQPLHIDQDTCIRNDGLRIEVDRQGLLRDYEAQATVIRTGREIRTSTIRPNVPLRVAGVGVWLMSYQASVRIDVRSQDGLPLTLESDSGIHSSGQASWNLSVGPALFRLPAEDLELHLAAAVEGATGTDYYVRIGRTGVAEPLFASGVAAGEELRVGDVWLTLHSAPYVLYRLKHDPAAPAVLASAVALVLGSSMSLFSRRRRT